MATFSLVKCRNGFLRRKPRWLERDRATPASVTPLLPRTQERGPGLPDRYRRPPRTGDAANTWNAIRGLVALPGPGAPALVSGRPGQMLTRFQMTTDRFRGVASGLPRAERVQKCRALEPGRPGRPFVPVRLGLEGQDHRVGPWLTCPRATSENPHPERENHDESPGVPRPCQGAANRSGSRTPGWTGPSNPR